MGSHMHRRKSSQGDDESTIIENQLADGPSIALPSPPRSRVHSTPASPSTLPKATTPPPGAPPASSPYGPSPVRTSFSTNNLTVNGHGHSRTRTISAPFSSSQGGSDENITSLNRPAEEPSANPRNHNTLPPLTAPPSGPPASAGPYRTSFSPLHAASPLRSSHSFSTNNLTINGHGHSRTRTISAPYSPPLPSPLSSSFSQSSLQAPNMTPSVSAPETSIHPQSIQNHTRRHSRMHSRNLSIFFPRPGSLPQNTIAEDGSQELEIKLHDQGSAIPIPSSDSNLSIPGRTRPESMHGPPSAPLGAGFTFGSRPPGAKSPVPPPMSADSSSGSSRRRGHHHKHSLSHNFFSFLEPGAEQKSAQPEDLHTQPTPVPISPWNPISPFPVTPAPTSTSMQIKANGHSHTKVSVSEPEPENDSTGALAWSISQFMLGGWLWVSGQQNGSLGVTGLGYWVVFDSFGVGINHLLPRWLKSKKSENDKLRRSYGDERVEVVFLFAQVVYLMFAAVYVCKETVEHVLLSAGGGDGEGHGHGHEGHHHHHADEGGEYGIDFPLLLTVAAAISVIVSAAFYQTHAKLVEITGNRIPPVREIIRSLSNPHRVYSGPPPTSVLVTILSNPYVLSPLVFASVILSMAFLVPPSNHIGCDLALAGLITILTFNLAYHACVVLGTVLLQTAPKRGFSGGKMEAFLRVMREIERHPNVLHLPAPHIWQVTPTPANPSAQSNTSLVVTLELHVKPDLSDAEVLALTKWAWQRCSGALGGKKGEDGNGKADVTVGVVRG